MNKLYFQGNVVDLYAEDYQYLQDSIEEEVAKLVEHTIVNNYQPAIVDEFNLIVDPTDTTKLMVHQNGLTGIVITSAGLLMHTTEDFSGISLSDASVGAHNIVFASVTNIYGTYDKETLEVVEEQTAIDFYDYSKVYNRVIDSCAIVVYTSAEYSALTSTGHLIRLGDVTGPGAGNPITSIDLTTRVYALTKIMDGSVNYSHLSSSFMLPQHNVESTEVLDIDDQYYGTPEDLIDDLNKVRTQIKNIKSTPHWDDFQSGIRANDPQINSLFKSGVFENTYDNYDYEITSSGASITIKSGKALIDSNIKEDLSTSTGISIPAGDRVTVGDFASRTNPEQHVVPQHETPGFEYDYTFNLSFYPATDLHVCRHVDGNPYLINVDYTVDLTTGVVTCLSTGDINLETVDCYYSSGRDRCDMIVVSASGFTYVEGTPAAVVEQPNPPDITSSGYLPLYYIYRAPLVDTITDADIVDGRIYVPEAKQGYHIVGTSEIATYKNWVFDRSHRAALNRLAFISVATGYGVASGAGWSVSGTSIVWSNTAYINTYLYTRPSDELWMVLNISGASTASQITMEYESTPGSGILSSKVITIPGYTQMNVTGLYPIQLSSTGTFDTGITHVKLTITSGSSVTFSQLLVGLLDLDKIGTTNSPYLAAIHQRLHSVNDTLEHTGVAGAVLNNLVSFNADGLFSDSGINATTALSFSNDSIGLVFMNPYETTPSNYIRAIGATLSGPSYPLLFAKYGQRYGSTFLGWQSVTVDSSADTISIPTTYSVSVNDAVTFNASVMPSPLVYGTTYYIRSVATGGGNYICTLSTTVGGSLIDITTNGTSVVMYSNMFKTPDYRGYFLRGYANGMSTDPDRSTRTDRGDGTVGDYIGTIQAHAFEDHTQASPSGYSFVVRNYPSGFFLWAGFIGSNKSDTAVANTGYASSGNTSTETRPINKSVDFIIKYQ